MKNIFAILFCLLSFSFANSIDWSDVAKRALKGDKFILVNVKREDCPYCESMERETFNNSSYRKRIETQYVIESVMYNQDNLPKAIKNVQFFPTNFIIDPKNMKLVDEFIGYMKPDDFTSLLKTLYEVEKN